MQPPASCVLLRPQYPGAAALPLGALPQRRGVQPGDRLGGPGGVELSTKFRECGNNLIAI